ncbi:MAG: histidinol-phosphate transaminase [Firmicutes bacterium]|nr:histidinol-phosphate transaminase [Bacillota bacterium]NLL87478.1 histidinol-phosphate transaminase [Bacillota bacterium]HKM17649.1 histidinol-phosphate transaminase [Limnochordia bacterium]
MIEHRIQLDRIKPYVPGKHIDQVKQELGITDVIKLASNENPLGMGRLAAEAITASAAYTHLYPDGHCTVLREKLAGYLGVTKEQIIVGNGSDEVLKMIAQTFLTELHNVIIADPTFLEYSFVADLMGAEKLFVPLTDYRHDLKAMAAQIDSRTKIVFVCNPNNPTGTIVDSTELEWFLGQIPEHILVVVDEAYYEYVANPSYPQTLELLKHHPNLMITRTFSKIYGLAGLRIGYGVAGPEIINVMERVKEPFNVNRLAQAAACASLDDHEHLRRSIAVNEEGKQYLFQQFEMLNLRAVPTETNFVLVDLERDARQVYYELMIRGIIVRPMDAFGLPSCIRVTIGAMEQNRRFIHALREVLYADRN